MLHSPFWLSNKVLIFTSAEWCLRVVWRILNSNQRGWRVETQQLAD
jgi:hypothetical protein